MQKINRRQYNHTAVESSPLNYTVNQLESELTNQRKKIRKRPKKTPNFSEQETLHTETKLEQLYYS